MALIKCPECGKEVSDKAAGCPNCGFPINELKKSEEDISEMKIDEAQQLFSTSEVVLRIDRGRNSYIEIRGDIMRVYNMLYDVTDYICNYILLYNKDTFGVPCIRFTHDKFSTPIRMEPMPGDKNISKIRELGSILTEKAIVNELGMIASANYRTDAQKEKARNEMLRKRQEELNSKKVSVDWNDIVEKNRTARCPKCKSTSITYDTKKLSVGRALVGDAVAGPVGAILGGMSSKKGYCVCMNCGKRWKI